MSEDKMDLEQAKQLADDLVKQAEEGVLPQFEFIRTTAAFGVAKTLKKSMLKIAKVFKTEANNFYSKYLEELNSGVDHLQLLVNHRQYKKWADYYYKSADKYDDMMYEFKAYVFYRPLKGLLILLGDCRPEEDLVDYSGCNLAK